MKRSLLAIFLAATFVSTGSIKTQALHDTQSTTVFGAREQAPTQTLEARTDEKRLEVEARKQELEQKLADKRAAITNKLMGERADKCQKKEININSMLDKRVESAQKHFDTFESIQTKLTTLVLEKDIDVKNHIALEVIMTDLGVKAQSSITVLKATDFVCQNADSVAPGAIVKDQVALTKQALKDYRDSIKDYAQAIKASVEKPAKSPAEEAPVNEDAPTDETPSTEQSIEGVSQ